MKALQIQANDFNNNSLLRYAGVKKIHSGWYTVNYRGVSLDKSTICAAKRNKLGKINLSATQQ